LRVAGHDFNIKCFESRPIVVPWLALAFRPGESGAWLPEVDLIGVTAIVSLSPLMFFLRDAVAGNAWGGKGIIAYELAGFEVQPVH
jgi:hypothetical protein